MDNVIHISNTQRGFTRMDNELYEALIGADLSGRELRVALAVHRFTVGYNSQAARIPAATIAKLSGIARENVSRIIGELIRQRVIFRAGGSKAPIGIAPFSEWKIDLKNEDKKGQAKTTQCVKSDTSLVSFPTHIKERKDNIAPTELVAAVASTAAEDKLQELNSLTSSLATSTAHEISASLKTLTATLIAEDVYGDAAPSVQKALDDAIAAAKAARAEAMRAEQESRTPYDKIAALYNAICGGVMPKCATMTDKRKRAIRGCWNLKIGGQHVFRDLDFWEGYFNDAADNAFLTGQKNGWRADFDFLTRASSAVSVLEGKYER